MYNPTIGRFMTRDPFAELGGLNLYEYADNDPVNKTDPTGLAAETTTGGPNAEIEEQLALEGAMNLAWLQDEYEGWTFTPFPGGYTGIDSRGRQMTFDSELNQTGYASGRRQFRLEYRDDGSVVRAWMDLDTGKTWDNVLVESAEIRKMRQNPYWDAYVDQAQSDATRLANTLALAEGVGDVLDATVRIASGPAGTVLIDVPEAVTGQNMTRPGQTVGVSDRLVVGATVGVVAVRNGKRLLTIGKNALSGGSFERAVFREMPGVSKNWRIIQATIPYRGSRILWASIPDVLVSKKAIIEIKKGREIYLSRQLLTQLTYARKNNLRYRLIVSPTSRLTAELIDKIKSQGGTIEVFNRKLKTFSAYVP
jgi:hypothetical protein